MNEPFPTSLSPDEDEELLAAEDPVAKMDQAKEMLATLDPDEQEKLPTTMAAVASVAQAEKSGASKVDFLQRTLGLKSRNSELTQEILDLSQRQAKGTPLRRDQAVAAIFLAIAPILAGAVAKGKQGALMGAKAGQVGATLQTKSAEEDRVRDREANKLQIDLKKDEIRDNNQTLRTMQQEEIRGEYRSEAEKAKVGARTEIEQKKKPVAESLRKELEEALGEELPAEMSDAELNQRKAAAEMRRGKGSDELRKQEVSRRDTAKESDLAMRFKTEILERRVQGLKFRDGATPNEKGALATQKAAAGKAQVDRSLQDLDRALRSRGKERLQEISETMADAIFTIKEAKNLGAAFTQMERDLVNALLPGVDITELSRAQIVNKLNATWRRQNPLSVVARARARLDANFMAGAGQYGYELGQETPEMLLGYAQGIGIPEEVARSSLQGFGIMKKPKAEQGADAGGGWRVVTGPDGKKYRTRR